MDLQSLIQYKKSKRRERAARMAEEPVGILDDLDSAEEEDTDLLKLKPPRPPRPKKIKETLKEPLYEEDIIEGFSFCSFKTYEDLDKMAKWSSQHNGKYPDPYSKLKLDEEKKLKKKKKKKDKNRDRDSILSQIDPNANKGSSGSSSEKGYICDSDSDGDKGSDTGVGDFFRARKLSNVCQNGLSSGGGTAVKSEGGVASVALPAVPLPESVARSLKVPSTGAPFGSPPAQSSSGGAPPPAPQAAPPPKPFYRPFAISPPPSSTAANTSVAPPSIPSSAPPPPLPHPAYRHFGVNPYYPGSLGPVPVSTYGDLSHYYATNGLIPPTKTTTPSITGTNTVASSHYNDLTCKSHLPKLAHALTTTVPRATPPGAAPSPKSYLPLNDPANLRRELDSRYFNRNLALGPPPFMRSDLTSNPLAPPLPSSQSPSFLASSLTKEVPKMGGPNSLFAGLGNPPGFHGISPLGSSSVDPLRTSTTPSTSMSTPSSILATGASSSSHQQPKKTGKWNAMHVRIAWEIYNHQQKQKGSSNGGDSKKPGDGLSNPLANPTSSLSSKASATATSAGRPPQHGSGSSSDLLQQQGQKRPASGNPPQTDFMHKRPATDAEILRNQLFPPPRPPPNPLDQMNPLLQRPPYMPPYGHSPLQASLTAFPRFGASAVPFGGLGSLRDAQGGPANPLSYPGLVSSASDFFGLPRPPSFPSMYTSAAAPPTSLAAGHASIGWPLVSNEHKKIKPPSQTPPTPKDRRPKQSPSPRNSNGTIPAKTHNNGGVEVSRSPSLMRPPSTSSSPSIVRSDQQPSSSSLDLSFKKEDHEVSIVGEKVNNHVPNGRTSVDNRPPSRHSNSSGLHNHHKAARSSMDNKTLAASLARPPLSSPANSMNPFGLAGLYPHLGHPGLQHHLFGLDPYRAAAAASLNPYLQSRESLLRFNQLMMTEQERTRMGLNYPIAPPTPGLFPPPGPPGATPMMAKPPGPPSLGYPPGFPPGYGASAAAAASLGLGPLPPGAAGLNGHAPNVSSATGSPYHPNEHHHPLR